MNGSAPALAIDITYLRAINWSLLRAGIPPVWRLAVRNRSPFPATRLDLRLRLPGYLDTGPLPLPAIDPGAALELSPEWLTWVQRDFEAAMGLSSRRETYLELTLGAGTAYLPVNLLTPDEWCAGVGWDGQFVLEPTVEVAEASFEVPPGGTVAPRLGEAAWQGEPPLAAATAALVLPELPRVAAIKANAVGQLAAIAGQPHVALEEFAAGSALQRTQVVQAVFMALADLYPKAFHDLEKFSRQAWSQRIRFPDEAVGDDAARRHGATCVDYALLVCAVLEACGLAPVFVLVGVGHGVCHALAGCWLARPPRARAVWTDGADLRTCADRGLLLVVDVTRFSTGKNFAEASAAGKACLGPGYHFCWALDIGEARRAYHIDPLPGVPVRVVEPQTWAPRFVHALLPARDYQERAEAEPLRAFWRRQGAGGVLGLVGIGGSGKTALVERFLLELPGSSHDAAAVPKRRDLPPPNGLFVWSFYLSPKCEDFLGQLYRYACRQPDPVSQLGPNWCLDRIQTTLEGRTHARTLLVLDGLEKVQKERDVLGHFTKEAEPIGRFLQWVAGRPQGLWVIATSRFPLTDLEPWRDHQSYTAVTLDQLDPPGARALLRARGVKGTDAALDRLTAEFGRHPLTLTHLGGLLARFYGGAPARARELPPLTQVGWGAEQDVQAQRLSRVLARYEEKLTPEELGVLKAVSAFRLPVSTETLAGTLQRAGPGRHPGKPPSRWGAVLRWVPFVRRRPPDRGLTLPDRRSLPALLAGLTDLQLIQENYSTLPTGPFGGEERPTYSAHPAVSQYFYGALLEDARLLHEGASVYLQRELERQEYVVETRGQVRVRGTETVTRAFLERFPRDPHLLDLIEELIYHTLKKGQVDQAFAMYRDRLGGYRHLGEELGQHVRGQRILALFRSEAECPADIDADYQRYEAALSRG